MAGRKSIFTSLFILLAACFLITLIAFAEEGQKSDEDYTPGFYYTVQKGDTLWGLSRKFYDTGWDWPALWGQNTDLTNPHLIYPGQRIRLYQRTDALNPPQKAAAAEDAGIAPAKEDITYGGTGGAQSIDEAVYYLYPGIAYIGFVEKRRSEKNIIKDPQDDPLAMGVILKAQGDKKEIISQNDIVYISPVLSNGINEDSFIVGTRYCIYAPPTKVVDPVTKDYTGHQYKIIGIAEVTTKASQYIMAKVIKSLDTINAGCRIMPFEKRDKEIEIQPAPPGLTGEILIAENGAEMSSVYSIVFLNKGEKDGVSPGQRYDIYYQDKHVKDDKEMMLAQYVYGEMLVLLTKEANATAIITKSINPIRAGALFKSAL